MILTISGPPGSGKSTTAKKLSERLGFERFYMGAIMREIARKRGITLEELLTINMTDKSVDIELDDEVRRLGEKDNIIVESRTAWHFIPHSTKIFVDVSVDESTKRIWNDILKNPEIRNENIPNNLEEMKEQIIERRKNEAKRYMKHYGIDIFDKSNYDIVVDSTDMNPEEVVNEIQNKLPIYE